MPASTAARASAARRRRRPRRTARRSPDGGRLAPALLVQGHGVLAQLEHLAERPPRGRGRGARPPACAAPASAPPDWSCRSRRSPPRRRAGGARARADRPGRPAPRGRAPPPAARRRPWPLRLPPARWPGWRGPASGVSNTAWPSPVTTVARVPSSPRSSISVARTCASAASPKVTVRPGKGAAAAGDAGVVGRAHEQRRRVGAFEDLGLRVGDRVARREEAQVGVADVGPDADFRLGDAHERADLARVIHPQLEHRHVGLAGAAASSTAAGRCGCSGCPCSSPR